MRRREFIKLVGVAALAAAERASAKTPTNFVALSRQNPTMPIVFVEVSDPVAQGFVANLDHPGGNVTGCTAFQISMGGQWIELLKQIAPAVDRVLLIFNPETSPIE